MKASLGVLQVFVTMGCRGCRRAQELVAWIRSIKPNLSIQVIDLAVYPDAGLGLVFAVPTYVYNSRPIFVGNPSTQELRQWLDNLEA
ncbi:MAG: thioredoxin family protein [Chloroflexi bacterium]|nr:thioredoxin family protein [Chloroflexota bacterium]